MVRMSVSEEDVEEMKESVPDFTTDTLMSDIEFVVEGRSIFASKNVLGLCSPVFRAMFSSDFKEKEQSKVVLPDKKYTDFLVFLRCLYPYVSQEINGENVDAVLSLANEYDVGSLVKKCEEYLPSKLKKECQTEALISTLIVVHRCNITSIDDLIISKLATRDPREIINIFSSDEEMGRVIPMSILNRILVSKHDQIMKLQTDFVHMSFFQRIGEHMKKVDGFEDAQGGIIEFTLSDISSHQHFFQSESISIFGLRFFLYGKFENVGGLSIELVCEKETKAEDSKWFCTVKAYSIIKNPLKEGNLCNVGTFSYDGGSERLQFSLLRKLSELLDKSAGFVKDDKLEIAVYILVNKPVVERKSDFK